MSLAKLFENLRGNAPDLLAAAERGHLRALASLLGPAWRGLVKQAGKGVPRSAIRTSHEVSFDWSYRSELPEMRRLYEAAKSGQWDAATDLDWTISVDPDDPERPIVPDDYVPVFGLPVWERLERGEKNRQRHALVSWILSQFLHGEQGALFAACQVTSAVPWIDGKLYGSTQVVDEGRHVEVFHRYLEEKLGKRYEINDNLYVIVDALMADGRWDVKFLGMQILIEGLALGAFGALRRIGREPLLRDLLRFVITDEARHVHYGVLAIQEFVREGLDERGRREREEWAFEVAVLLRNRFLAHEFYDEYYGQLMTRAAWNQLMLRSRMMALFRRTMFRRIIPNLRRIGLLGERVRPRYAELGLLDYEHGRAAPDLTAQDLLDDAD